MRTWFRANYSGAFAAHLVVVAGAVRWTAETPEDYVTQTELEKCHGRELR